MILEIRIVIVIGINIMFFKMFVVIRLVLMVVVKLIGFDCGWFG